MKKILITGTGRSGTGWASTVLNRAGIKCGHQAVFKHEHTLSNTLPTWGDWEADSSFEAVPMLPRLGPDVTVVLLLRYPLAMIRSWLEHAAFGDDMSQRFGQFWQVLQRHHPAVLNQVRPVDRAALYWLSWNTAAYENADFFVRLEDIGAVDLARIVTEGVSFEQVPVDHARADKMRSLPSVEWEDISRSIRVAVRRAARDWGYERTGQ